jgi:hypothetical protein
MRTFLVVVAALFALPALGVEPPAETSRAFDQYVTVAEKQLREGVFIYSDAHPEAKTAARSGQTVVVQQRSGEVRVTGGLIHDWLGFSFFSGAHLAEVRTLMQDYGNYKRIYTPDVIDSKLVTRDGDRFRVFLKLQNQQFIPLTYDSEYDVSYSAPAADRLEIISHSSRIQQAGIDQGFLWRLNSYWRFVEADGGVPQYFSLSLHSVWFRLAARIAGEVPARLHGAYPGRNQACRSKWTRTTLDFLAFLENSANLAADQQTVSPAG